MFPLFHMFYCQLKVAQLGPGYSQSASETILGRLSGQRPRSSGRHLWKRLENIYTDSLKTHELRLSSIILRSVIFLPLLRRLKLKVPCLAKKKKKEKEEKKKLEEESSLTLESAVRQTQHYENWIGLVNIGRCEFCCLVNYIWEGIFISNLHLDINLYFVFD